MTTVVERLASNFTDATLPKLYKDPLLNSGSLFLFDFLNPYTNPLADGAIASGAAFKNLVEGGADATITGAGMANLAGKKGLDLTAGGGLLGLGIGRYNQAPAAPPLAAQRDFLVIFWHKLPNAGFNATAYRPFFQLTTGNANVAQWIFDGGPDGKTPRATIGYTTNGPGGETRLIASGTGQGAPQQLAIRWKAGQIFFYVNGALSSASGVTANINTLFDAATAQVNVPPDYKGTVYRIYEEDLTISGQLTEAQALARVKADYDLNIARFT